ncbi:type II secretion system protein GspM [Gluconobacter sp. DsW_056]|uniref:type II secretion system protein GspM n=1 Tax=Gluconobacter sp. DsW_056 TaxID=1511209 RepID=UPI001E553C9A|nr:type II secretion system protein GspM [Gluconobacter sp. DsW_056]
MSASALPPMSGLPDGRKGRLLALGMTFVVLVLVASGASLLLNQYAEGQADLAEQQDILTHTQILVDTLPDLEKRARTASLQARGSTLLISETSQETALARLQQIVHDAALEGQALPTSMEPLPVSRTGAFERLGVRVSLTTSYAVLVRLLDALDHSTAPRLLVDDLRIDVSGNPQAIDETAEGRALDASFTILALRDPRSIAASTAPRP